MSKEHRRVILLALLAVALGVFLIDAHGSPRLLVEDLKATWADLRTAADVPHE
jgi:hypothetical protein